ncbi:hypothetical protein RhiirC2_804351 [Rhizophagus irregularis]|uniref:Uncharacterized protein n=1 Tax=Rhizophagus irregularis TaxID=588596 RepID=A0A2N1L134_9GLOM|nr:hypothetical protein RhiirC2_804351 [Rhizophagus irregularis]
MVRIEHAQLRVNADIQGLWRRYGANLQLIKKAESHGVIQKFTTLNDEFTRIKEENREIYEKIINNKRATKSKMEKNIKRDG